MSDAGDEEEVKPYAIAYEKPPTPDDGDDQCPAGEAQPCISRDGKATATFPNEDTYAGEYKEKKRNGRGKYTWTKLGAVYDGDYQNGIREGQGKMTYPDGSEYTGHWTNNLRQGFGTYYYADGNRYSGHWDQGKKHGDGTFIFAADASQLEGKWDQDKFTEGNWAFADGTKYFGKFACAPKKKDGDEDEEETEAEKPKEIDVSSVQPLGAGMYVFPSGNQQAGVYTPEGRWVGGQITVSAAA